MSSTNFGKCRSWTHNEKFDNDGFLVVRNICNSEYLYTPIPSFERGSLIHYGKTVNDYDIAEEAQVAGSIARYNYPQYRDLHKEIGKKLEDLIGRKLYTTYFYDRFYFSGQELKRHKDRESCEISFTLHVSNNLPDNLKDWPIWIQSPHYVESIEEFETKYREIKDHSSILNSGDGMIYKGCDCEHWRDPMPFPRRRKRDMLLGKKYPEYYYHQIFFHYVLQDGYNSHFAFDKGRNVQ